MVTYIYEGVQIRPQLTILGERWQYDRPTATLLLRLFHLFALSFPQGRI
jgi:hypothetical protein